MSFLLDLIKGGMSKEEREYLGVLERMVHNGEITKQEAERKYQEAKDSLQFLNTDESE